MYEYQKQGSITKLPCIIYGFKNITFAHNLLVYLYGLSFSHIGTRPELVNCLAKQFRHCIKTCYQIYTPPRSIIQSISVYYGKYFGTVPVTFQLTTHSNKRNIHEVIISGDYVQGTSYNPVSNGSLSTQFAISAKNHLHDFSTLGSILARLAKMSPIAANYQHSSLI